MMKMVMMIRVAVAFLFAAAALFIMACNIYFAYRGARHGHAPSGINVVPGILLALAGMALRANILWLVLAFLLDFGSTLGAAFLFGLMFKRR